MKNWIQQGNFFKQDTISTQYPKLPVGIYELKYDDKIGFYLTYISEKFNFSYKIYGVERNFIDYTIKTYHHTTGNFGILLNGIKGTGKTITAEIICNELNLPIIVVNSKFENVHSFISGLQEDIVLFFDEYDKHYKQYDYSILSVMDGALNGDCRKFFMLTTNNKWVDDNLLQRPGRIRYIKEFSDLKLDVVEEVLDDLLKYPEHRSSIIQYLTTMEIITIDIVKSVVEEVNIHNTSPDSFSKIFNASKSEKKVTVTIYKELTDEVDKEIKGAIISPKLSEIEEEDSFYVERSYIGEIGYKSSDNEFIVFKGESSFKVKIEIEESVHKTFKTFKDLVY